MIRRFGTAKLKGEGIVKEDINPMEGIANLADVMLILAVGIMLALVMHWNVDISTKEVTQKQEIKDMEDQEISEKIQSQKGFEELGTVYKDPETGKMYMVVREKK